MACLPLLLGLLIASVASAREADLRDEKGRLKSEIARQAAADRAKRSAEEKRKQDEGRAFLEAFRIEDDGGCLAYDPARQDCAVTISEFNKSGTLYPFEPPDDTSSPRAFQARIAQAREVMLHALLEPRFLASRLEDSLHAPDFRGRWESAAPNENAYANAEQDSGLQRIYKTYFPSHFRGRDSLIVQFLAATDSSLLDSLWGTDPGNPSCREGGSQKPDMQCRGKSNLAWRKYPQPLPQALREELGHLPLGKTAGPFRVSFGFLLLKPVRWVKIPERSFRDCLPLLIEISNLRRMAGNKGKSPSGPATDPAASSEESSFWMWPAPTLGKKTGNGRTRFPAVFDTLACKPLRFSREDLPAPIQFELNRLGPLRPGEFIPFRWGKFGVWALRMGKHGSTFQAAQKAPKPSPPIEVRAKNEETLFAAAQERLEQKYASKEAGRFRTYLQSRLSAASAGSGYERDLGVWIGAHIEILSRL